MNGIGAAHEVKETHSGYVVLIGDRAYKVKKHETFDFADFSDAEVRRAAAAREIELNRRLSPDVYLEMLEVTGVAGEPRDFVVVMKRLPAQSQLDGLIDDGRDISGVLREVAHTMAGFHAAPVSEPPADYVADPGTCARQWGENLWALRHMPGLRAFQDDLDAMEERVAQYLGGRTPLIESRIRAGAVRDGHGDLRCDSIYVLDDGVRILDCLDFDDSLRIMDVLADVTFLVADLEYRGRSADGRNFLDYYKELRGDRWPESLAHLHMAYWATVRAKVAAIRSLQLEEEHCYDAVRWLEIAQSHLERTLVRIVLVGGAPGTGKSTLSESIADERDWLLVRSDDVRHDVAGIPRSEHQPSDFGTGLYAPDVSRRTYAEMLRRAGEIVARGESVVLDATWSSQSERAHARRVAARCGALATEVHCVAARCVVAGRITERARRLEDPSDATLDVSDAIAARFDPWPDAWVVDTGASGPSATAAMAMEALP